MAVPRELQGKKQSFDVAANVQYPSGTGKMFRKLSGLKVPLLIDLNEPSSGSGNSGDSSRISYGQPIQVNFPARVTLVLPMGVRENGVDTSTWANDVKWTLRDLEDKNSATS